MSETPINITITGEMIVSLFTSVREISTELKQISAKIETVVTNITSQNDEIRRLDDKVKALSTELNELKRENQKARKNFWYIVVGVSSLASMIFAALVNEILHRMLG